MICETLHLKDIFPCLGLNDADPTLDLYLPYNMTDMNRQDQKRPCLVVCPGGGYHICSQREAEPIALQFTAIGYNVFVLNYSVDTYRFPTQLRETAAVMDLIHSNSAIWNCDTSRIAIMGFSAGGHLAAHYSTSYDHPEVRKVFSDSKPVAASILCYPVISTDPAVTHHGSLEHLLDEDWQERTDLDQFSCDLQVTDQTPPAFIWHTSQDGSVPVENSLRYVSALARHKIPFEYHVYPLGGHGLSLCTAEVLEDHEINEGILYASRWMDEARAWLKLMLK